jgi:hypothetical protein
VELRRRLMPVWLKSHVTGAQPLSLAQGSELPAAAAPPVAAQLDANLSALADITNGATQRPLVMPVPRQLMRDAVRLSLGSQWTRACARAGRAVFSHTHALHDECVLCFPPHVFPVGGHMLPAV